jgi:nucleolar protein 56
MTQKTWFGEVDLESCSLIQAGSLDQMIEKLIHDPPAKVEDRLDPRALAKMCSYVKDDCEYNRLLREACLELVRRGLRDLATDEQDLLQMIEALDDLDMTINHLDERLREWSMLHDGDGSNIRDLSLHNPDLQDLTHLDTSHTIAELAAAISNLRRSRGRIEEALISSMAGLSPNLSEMAGPLLAARLISRAGSLRRLSQMPSSSIQIMGAERSLFKHLKGKAPSPKHGLIYRHPGIMNAPKNLRGRLARALAGKLAIAARVDYHSGVKLPELKESLDRRLQEISRKGRSRRPQKKNIGIP